MLSWITGIDIKYVLYIIIALMIAVGGWKMYSLVHEAGQKDIIIETQKESLKQQDALIIKLKLSAALVNQTLASRDKELSILQDQVENLTNDLGDDSKDQAPKSIKELFRRLQQ